MFVDEPLIPRLRLNQPATVYTDAGGAGIAGTVTYISPKAEFTPRNVQTAEERSKLVYRVRVSVTNERRTQAGDAGGRGPATAAAMTQPARVLRPRQQEVRRDGG